MGTITSRIKNTESKAQHFRTHVSKQNLDEWIKEAYQYFPDAQWTVSMEGRDQVIRAKNLNYAIKKLNPSDGDTIDFETDRFPNDGYY